MSISRLQYCSAFLGNIFEHYDTALFVFLAPFFAPLFFPEQEPLSALVLTYAIIPLGMLARPLGSLLFGYIAGRRGRTAALVLSLFCMGGVSGLIGLLPTYSQVGRWAPLLLSFARVLQNIFASGETIGGAVYLIEHTSEKRKDIVSSLFHSSTVIGILAASAGVYFLYATERLDSYWRVLYFIGASTALFGAFIRLKMPVEKVVDVSPSLCIEMFKLFWEKRGIMLQIALAAGFSYSCYSVAFVLMNGLIPLVSDITPSQVMGLNTLMLVVDCLILPLFGLLASKFSRIRMMVLASAAAVMSGVPLFSLLEGAVLSTVVIVRLLFVVIGVWFSATFHSWSQSLLPVSQRYAVISFAYAIGSQVFGGPTAAVSLWLFKQTGSIAAASLYWTALAAGACLLITRSVKVKASNRFANISAIK